MVEPPKRQVRIASICFDISFPCIVRPIEDARRHKWIAAIGHIRHAPTPAASRSRWVGRETDHDWGISSASHTCSGNNPTWLAKAAHGVEQLHGAIWVLPAAISKCPRSAGEQRPQRPMPVLLSSCRWNGEPFVIFAVVIAVVSPPAGPAGKSTRVIASITLTVFRIRGSSARASPNRTSASASGTYDFSH